MSVVNPPRDQLRLAIQAMLNRNEGGSAYAFSPPANANSGWAFGVFQWDVRNRQEGPRASTHRPHWCRGMVAMGRPKPASRGPAITMRGVQSASS